MLNTSYNSSLSGRLGSTAKAFLKLLDGPMKCLWDTLTNLLKEVWVNIRLMMIKIMGICSCLYLRDK